MTGDNPRRREQRELEAVDRALAGLPVDADLEDVAALAHELRDGRARPSADYAERLDRQVGRALEGRRSRGRSRPGWLRVALPAAAAVLIAVVAVVAAGGGGGGDAGSGGGLALVAIPGAGDRGATEAAPQAAPRSDAPSEPGAGAFSLRETRVVRGDPIVLDYTYARPTPLRAELAGREGEVRLEPGEGRVEIPTDDVEPGRYRLELEVGPLGPIRERVEVVEPL